MSKPEVSNSRWQMRKPDVLVSQLLCKVVKICMFWGLENSVALLVMLYLGTGNEKVKMTAAKPELHISQLQYKVAKKFILFSGSENLMTPSKGSMSEPK
jgi:hypothetical protein